MGKKLEREYKKQPRTDALKNELRDEVRVKILGEDEKEVMLDRLGYVGEPKEKKVGLQGFLCPRDGNDKKFNYCWSKCRVHCHPLPVLLALAHQYRPVEPNVYHVTEVLQPPRIVYMARNYSYYLNPDSIVDLHVGTAWHEKLEETKKYVEELGLEGDYLMEQNFRKRFMTIDQTGKELVEAPERKSPLDEGEVWLSGTSDLYVKSTNTLWDYKIMKYFYTFKYLSEGKWEDSTIPWQMNIYRRFQYRKADLKILVYIKDWKRNFPEKYGVDRIEQLCVPHIPDSVIDRKIKELLTEHVKNQQDPSNIRPCTEKETWGGIRCQDYCPIKDLCSQYKENK